MSEENVFLFHFLEQLDKKREEVETKMSQLKISMTSIQDEINNISLKSDMNNYYFLPMSVVDEQKKKELTESLHESLLEMREYEQKLSKIVYEQQMFSNIFKKYQLHEMNDIISGDTVHSNLENCMSVEDGLGLQILETQELERKRIARELHDSTVQNLTNFVHKTELCMKLVDIDTVRARLELQSMIESIHTTINDMRGIIYNLRPMSIDDLGLVVTVQRYINQIKDNFQNIKFSYEIINEDKCNNSIVNLTLFRIIQEACNNALKYSKASNVVITIEYQEKNIKLQIKDNGVGFDMNYLGKKRRLNTGFGLSIMKERVYLLMGKIDIKSKKNEGTMIDIEVPYTNKREDEEE